MCWWADWVSRVQRSRADLPGCVQAPLLESHKTTGQLAWPLLLMSWLQRGDQKALSHQRSQAGLEIHFQLWSAEVALRKVQPLKSRRTPWGEGEMWWLCHLPLRAAILKALTHTWAQGQGTNSWGNPAGLPNTTTTVSNRELSWNFCLHITGTKLKLQNVGTSQSYSYCESKEVDPKSKLKLKRNHFYEIFFFP